MLTLQDNNRQSDFIPIFFFKVTKPALSVLKSSGS